MINIISNWAGELVVSLVVVTIIEMLLPENKIKKYVKTVIGIYIIFCIISPFIDKEEFSRIFENAQKDLEKIQTENQVTSNLNTDTTIENLYIQEFEKEITKKVGELGYKVNKCEVDIQIDATKENAGINAIYINISDKKTEQNSNIEIENIQKIEISINNTAEGNNKNDIENEDIRKVRELLSSYYEIKEEKIKIIKE